MRSAGGSSDRRSREFGSCTIDWPLVRTCVCPAARCFQHHDGVCAPSSITQRGMARIIDGRSVGGAPFGATDLCRKNVRGALGQWGGAGPGARRSEACAGALPPGDARTGDSACCCCARLKSHFNGGCHSRSRRQYRHGTRSLWRRELDRPFDRHQSRTLSGSALTNRSLD